MNYLRTSEVTISDIKPGATKDFSTAKRGFKSQTVSGSGLSKGKNLRWLGIILASLT